MHPRKPTTHAHVAAEPIANHSLSTRLFARARAPGSKHAPMTAAHLTWLLAVLFADLRLFIFHGSYGCYFCAAYFVVFSILALGVRCWLAAVFLRGGGFLSWFFWGDSEGWLLSAFLLKNIDFSNKAPSTLLPRFLCYNYIQQKNTNRD